MGSKKDFVELDLHIGVIKHLYLGEKDSFVYGLIIGIADESEFTKDSMVQFKKEGTTEVTEIKLATFERVASVIREIDEQFATSFPIVKREMPQGTPKEISKQERWVANVKPFNYSSRDHKA